MSTTKSDLQITVDVTSLQEALDLAEQLKETLEQVNSLIVMPQAMDLPDVYFDRNSNVYTRVSLYEYEKTNLDHPGVTKVSPHELTVVMLTDQILNNKDALREVTKHFL